MSAPDLDGLITVVRSAAYEHLYGFACDCGCDEARLGGDFTKLAQTIHEKLAAPLLERIAELETQLHDLTEEFQNYKAALRERWSAFLPNDGDE